MTYVKKRSIKKRSNRKQQQVKTKKVKKTQKGGYEKKPEEEQIIRTKYQNLIKEANKTFGNNKNGIHMAFRLFMTPKRIQRGDRQIMEMVIMDFDLSQKIHNMMFGLEEDHDHLRIENGELVYPKCCNQSSHFFKNGIDWQTNLYYGISKFNDMSYENIRALLDDAFTFTKNIIEKEKIVFVTNDQGKKYVSLAFHFTYGEPIHIWLGGKGTNQYDYVKKLTRVTKEKAVELGIDMRDLRVDSIIKILHTDKENKITPREYHIIMDIDETLTIFSGGLFI